MFLMPDEEVLVADDGAAVAGLLRAVDRASARRIGARARARLLDEHTYAQRALAVEAALAAATAGRGTVLRGEVA
jgi:hypothetical protein